MSAQIRGLSAPSAGKFREDKALKKKTPAADRLQAGEEESAVFCQTDRVWLTRLDQNLC